MRFEHEVKVPDDYYLNIYKGKKELDPNGKDPHEAGAKLDAGKQRPALVLNGFSRALTAVTEIGSFGAQKYTPNGWLSVPNGKERYEDAGARHRLARARGEETDPESGFLHLAHEAWNILAILELQLREKNDTR